MRPDERLPTKRTLSSGSRVPPAVTRTRRPASDPGASSCSTRAAISCRLGEPADAPLALGHLALVGADELDAARDAASRRSRASPALAHMRGFIAGATSTGPRCASAASVRTLSAIPCASFASVFAVHGATTSRSARVRCS